MRYELTHQVRATSALIASAEFPNRAMADANFEEVKGRLQPGEQVFLQDNGKGGAALNAAYRKTAEEHAVDVEMQFGWFFDEKAAAKQLAQLAAGIEKSLNTAEAYDVTSTFRWADGAFEAASWMNVARQLKAARARGVTLATLHEEAVDQIKRRSRDNGRSTSQCANIEQDCTLKAWADAEEKLAGLVRFEAKGA